MPKVSRHTGKSTLTVRTNMFGFVTPKETNTCFACHNQNSEKRSMQTLQSDLEKWGMIS